MARTLDVYLNSDLVGRLVQDDGGQMSFAYSEGWLVKPDAMPISRSLPLRTEQFRRNECRGFFAADELRLGVDAGFECVHGGAGLALGGAGSGGFLRVATIGRELFLGCHKTGG